MNTKTKSSSAQNIQFLAETLLKTPTQEGLEKALLCLLTPKEIEEFSNRLEILKGLKAGLTQREIAQKLGVGIATVSRGAKAFKEGQFLALEPFL